MVERKDPAFTEAPATDRAPALRPALMTPRRDSSNLVPIVILGGAMSMTLLGAIAWFQVQQRTPPDAMPVHTRSVIVYMPTPTPPQPTGAPCPSYGQRGLGANETAVPNDCVDGLPDAAALRAQATRDAMELIERGVEDDRARMELIERGVEDDRARMELIERGAEDDRARRELIERGADEARARRELDRDPMIKIKDPFAAADGQRGSARPGVGPDRGE